MLADFWGYEKLDEVDKSYTKGVSLVITNTTKGFETLQNINQSVFCQQKDIQLAIKSNPFISESIKINPYREKFFSDVKNGLSYKELKRFYMNNSGIKYILKKLAKKIIKK
jgi:hypothetical protein